MDELDRWRSWIDGGIGQMEELDSWINWMNWLLQDQQGFAGRDCRQDKPDGWTDPKDKTKKESLEDFSSKLSI